MGSIHEHDHPEERASYEALDDALSLADARLEIELLPPSLTPSPLTVQRDGLSLGVPKSLLILAFKHVKRHAPTLLTPLESDLDRATIHKATRIMLLTDPENLSAANARKRRLLALAPTRPGSPDASSRDGIIEQELHLLDTLLNSPLRRHTKSPTLWSHRRWLVTTFYDEVARASAAQAEQRQERKTAQFPAAPHTAGFTSLLRRELLVVARAGSLHPANYTAWDYARKLLRIVQSRSGDSSSSSNTAAAGAAAADVDGAVAFVHAWCRAHVSDVSGWAFLAHLLRAARSSGPKVAAQVLLITVDEAERYRYAGAAVWSFLRTAAAQPSLLCLTVEQRRALLERIGGLAAPATTEVCPEGGDGVGVLLSQTRQFRLAVQSHTAWTERFAQWEVR